MRALPATRLLDPAGGLEGTERLAQWDTADAEVICQSLLVEALASCELSADDRVLEKAVDLPAQRGSGCRLSEPPERLGSGFRPVMLSSVRT